MNFGYSRASDNLCATVAAEQVGARRPPKRLTADELAEFERRGHTHRRQDGQLCVLLHTVEGTALVPVVVEP